MLATYSSSEGETAIDPKSTQSPPGRGQPGGTDDCALTERPVVSAIIPTHNRAHCLPRALDSVFAQQGLGEQFEIEIIVVDDGSSDSTPDVIRRYRGVQRVWLPERRGVSAALNAGLRVSTGRYISFLGDDDEWLPHKLRVQIPELDAHPDVGVVYGQSLIRRDNGEEHPSLASAPSGWVFRAMLMDNFCGHHASALFRREVFDRVGSFDESLASGEDYDMSLRIAFHFPFRFIPGTVDIYNLSPRGLWLTRTARGLAGRDAACVIEKALQMLPDSARYAGVKREARARVALGAVILLLEMGDLTQAWASLIEALRKFPWIVGYEWARRTVTRVTCARARAAPCPLAVTRDLCMEVKAVVAASAIREHLWVRKTAAMVWAWLAISLAFDSPRDWRGVARAAGCAAAQAPLYVTKLALRHAARGGLRRLHRP